MRRGHSKRAPMGMNPVQKLILNFLLPMWAGQPYLRGFSTLTPHHWNRHLLHHSRLLCDCWIGTGYSEKLITLILLWSLSLLHILHFSVWSFTSGNAANSYKIWTFLYGCWQNCLFTQNHPWRFEPFTYHGRHCFFPGGKSRRNNLEWPPVWSLIYFILLTQ